MFGKVFVAGAGSWGATIAAQLSEKAKVFLWEKDSIRRKFLKENLHPMFFDFPSDLKRKMRQILMVESEFPDADLFILATPAQAARQTLNFFKEDLKKRKIPVLILSKGIEIKTLSTMDVVFEDIFRRGVFGILSGPSHAEEVCLKKPTAVVIASKNREFLMRMQKFFSFSYLRPYTTDDVRGVALGGSLKNVYAIAAGMCDGLGLGINAKSALITRSLAEMVRIGTVFGGGFTTFMGLSGVGDLLTTCFSSYSRNRNLGEHLASGMNFSSALKSVKTVAEGAFTVKALRKITTSRKIYAPVCGEVYKVLYKGKSPVKAVEFLMSRNLKEENANLPFRRRR